VIHYHGGPITPDTLALRAWTGRHAFVSFAHRQQIRLAASVTQSFALDNGAFSFWKSRREPKWGAYAEWVKDWSTHPGFDFAVVPDLIEGTEAANDALVEAWPLPRHLSAPVWHTNESFERLARLARAWPRVCLGSSGEFDVARPARALPRLVEAVRRIADERGRPVCKLHGLRMLNRDLFTHLPLSSADSTNAARNAKIDSAWKGTYQPASKETRVSILVERLESSNSPGEVRMPCPHEDVLGPTPYDTALRAGVIPRECA
jgi:hypothetical protein